MFFNYFKVALRNLLRNKAFSLINISGLAIGMAAAILIGLWIQSEVSYDRFHPNMDRLYEVYSASPQNGELEMNTPTPQPLGPVLKKDYPEIQDAVRLGWPDGMLMNYKNKILKGKENWADPSVLTMFHLPMLKGDPKTALNDPYSIVVTQSMATKLFGSEDPMGKVVKLENTDNFTVTGLMKDLPDNTLFDFEFLNSSELLRVRNAFDLDWTDISTRTFVLLKPGASLANINAKIKDIDARHADHHTATETSLYPLSREHLYSDFKNGIPTGGRIDTVRTFILIAIFILLIACINFMNLSTARSEKRAKEIGIRKVSGAQRGSLILQFLGESLLIAFIAGVLSIAIVQLSLPAFNALVSKQLAINFGSPTAWCSLAGFIILTGILAGSYPAIFLAGFKPAEVLKGKFKHINAVITPRKVLVVLQFSFAIMLITSTIIVRQQIQYAEQRKTGYDKSNLVYLRIEGDMRKNYDLFRNDLLASGAAVAMSRTLSPLTQIWSGGHGLKWDGSDPSANISFDRSTTDGNLVKTAGLQLMRGRDLDPATYPTDSTACLINESAAKAINFKDPIGKTIFDNPDTWHIVGVVKDFVLNSPYKPTKPIIFKGPKYGLYTINVKLNPKRSTTEDLAQMEKIYKIYNPAYPFEYVFTDEEYAKKFNDEKLTSKLAGLFAGLTIFISCLGLVGLATFMAESRVKEVGVRKVLGATVGNIAVLLSRDFVKLVVIAALIASPIAWWAGNSWLRSFDYRISINGWIFVIAGLTAILIALCTVSYQAIRAALANPVKSLRSE